MKERKGTITKKLESSPLKKGSPEARIEAIELTLKEIKAMPSPLGEKWRKGMVQYYEKVLAELKSHGNGSSKAK